jgi:protein-S-isoprenylcysteine O-methyltransferase Ste14
MKKEMILKLLCAVILAVLTYFLASIVDKSTRLIIGIVIGLPSIILVITGRIQIGKSFAVLPKAKALVTNGLYSKIRHPLYLFIDIFFLSLIIISGVSFLPIIWIVLVVIQLIESEREEKLLMQAFGTEYEEYKAKTWF